MRDKKIFTPLSIGIKHAFFVSTALQFFLLFHVFFYGGAHLKALAFLPFVTIFSAPFFLFFIEIIFSILWLWACVKISSALIIRRTYTTDMNKAITWSWKLFIPFVFVINFITYGVLTNLFPVLLNYSNPIYDQPITTVFVFGSAFALFYVFTKRSFNKYPRKTDIEAQQKENIQLVQSWYGNQVIAGFFASIVGITVFALLMWKILPIKSDFLTLAAGLPVFIIPVVLIFVLPKKWRIFSISYLFFTVLVFVMIPYIGGK